MKKVCLKIAYNGSAYAGWQRQNNAITIQEIIENAIYKLSNFKCSLFAASRTDAGVHSKAQYATFIDFSNIPANRYFLALNTLLPNDIRIVNSFECIENFNPRYDVVYKTYIYTIYNSPCSSALLYNITSHIADKLDIQRMNDATSLLIGKHDFSAFEASGASVKSKVRTIFESKLEIDKEFIRYRISGDGFLYNMVRIIVGTLIDIGRGKLDQQCFGKAFKSKNRCDLGFTAEAKGLCLEEINYGNILERVKL